VRIHVWMRVVTGVKFAARVNLCVRQGTALPVSNRSIFSVRTHFAPPVSIPRFSAAQNFRPRFIAELGRSEQ
jgi:hypothetical protein